MRWQSEIQCSSERERADRQIEISARSRSLLLAISLLLSGIGLAWSATVELQTRTNWVFKADGIRISNQFPGARVNGCERIGEHRYRLLIKAENTPINRSPWYAFKIRSQQPREVDVVLRYHNATHRYHPKVSTNGVDWDNLDGVRWQLSQHRTQATLTLAVDRHPLWVAGQERIGVKQLRSWMKQISERPGVTRRRIGKSLGERGIPGIRFGSETATNFVIIVSRQHPPEVTGTVGMMAFIEKLLDDSDNSIAFRGAHAVLLVPMMNPDGIIEGHWRHNLAGVDLNRDWKDFNQPETRCVRDWIERSLQRRSGRPLLFLDFHSTYHNIFYTQKDEHPTVPADFTKNWLAACRQRLPHAVLRRSASHNLEKPTSKAWAYDRFGCPAITYEFGDEFDRTEIRKQATVAAEEMMKLLQDFVAR